MTYSIVARDAASGALGIAVQSHWFNVGGLVPAALPGVGAVATQANPDVRHKPRALALLRQGRSPEEVVEALLLDDGVAAHRQLAVVDAAGRAAGHTGASCIPAAGNLVGDGYVVQANMMSGTGVWPAMAEAYEGATGGFVSALLAALDAAEAAGETSAAGRRRRSWSCRRRGRRLIGWSTSGSTTGRAARGAPPPGRPQRGVPVRGRRRRGERRG